MERSNRSTEPKGFLLVEPGNIMQILPEDNRSWLTLFYSLPIEFVSKRQQYLSIPRCPYDVIRKDIFAELIDSDAFLELVWDCYAWSAWQFFEVPGKDGYRAIPGSPADYSGDFPLWRLSYAIIPYIREKFEMYGLSFQQLFNIPMGVEVPYFSYQQFGNLIGNLVPMIIKEQNWQPMIDEIWTNRDLKDYDERSSQVKTDFTRKWTHSRSKAGAALSLEELMGQPEEDHSAILTDPDSNFADPVLEKLLFEQFLTTLPEQDQEMLRLKAQGWTAQKLAERFGYLSHSTVMKRIQRIFQKYEAFREEKIQS